MIFGKKRRSDLAVIEDSSGRSGFFFALLFHHLFRRQWNKATN